MKTNQTAHEVLWYLLFLGYVTVLSSAALYAGLDGIWLNCKVPNPNTHVCYVPDDAVANCNSVSQAFCATVSMYEINVFPNGSVDSIAGLTTEQMTDCYQETLCVWDADPGLCVTGAEGPWIQKPKTIGVQGPCLFN